MRPLSIGFFTDTYVPQINGVTTLLPILDSILTEQGHEVYIFAPSYEDHRAHREDGKIFRFPAFKFLYHKESRVTIPYHREARSVFEKLDVVHSHTPFTMGMLAIRVSRKYDIPHLHTYHTLFTEYLHYLPRYLRPRPKVVKRISRAFCNRCDAVTVPSTPMREELASYGVRVPIYVLLFGMDLEAFARPPVRDVRADLGIPHDEKVLLCAGRLSREKNVSFVLRAFRRVLEHVKDVRLVIVGDGPARAELEREAHTLDLGDRVIFTGYRAWEVLVDYYRTADLFVYGSKTETQGIVYTEAQAAGLPVVAVGEMGPLEAVQDGVTGVLTREDEDEFAHAVVKLLEDEELYGKMSRAALEMSEKNSIVRSTERLLEIYRELIAARAGREIAHGA
jgi:glycosyltransferase involved in cell wall biosynthesis